MPTSPLTQMRRRTDRQEPEIPELSDTATEVVAPSEGIDIDRKAPGTARIVEPAHNIRRSFGLQTGSALAVTPSMIDDNELASQTVVDESEVFDDPFYEALVAVGLEDEPAQDAGDSEEEPSGTAGASQPVDEGETEPADASQDATAESAEVDDAVAAEAEIEAAENVDIEADAEDAVEAQPSEAPQSKPEPRFGLEYGSALAMVPSMIDDNLLCSGLVVDEEEVFDDPFFEALVAVEDADEPSEAPQELEAEEPESEPDEADGMLFTTASALVEEDDDETPRGKHARAVEEPAPEAESAPESESETQAEAEPELELSLDQKPEGGDSPAEEVGNEPAEPDASLTAAADEPTAEESPDDEAADTENASVAEEEASTPVEDDHAAAQEPSPSDETESSAEKLPDDESVADAVDEMVLNSDYEDERVSTPQPAGSSSTPAKQGFWSRFKNLFRRNR